MTFCFSAADISFSLDMPAFPAHAIPPRQTATPNRIPRPDTVPNTLLANPPSKIGGINVPNAAQYPSTIAIPSDKPRYRIVDPQVSPPRDRKSTRLNSSQLV